MSKYDVDKIFRNLSTVNEITESLKNLIRVSLTTMNLWAFLV
uniref:Uncharacterized protein n=1 Tax=Vibrio splendidus TaxID=29497 RepID=A0A0H3ZSQ3_VIBSP|nr:hypothetical protein [Vibrio splendidus]